MAVAAEAPPEVQGETVESIHKDPDFRELKRRFRAFAFPMTAFFLVWYLLYVVASGWARGFMGTAIFGDINFGLVFGLLQFVSTFLIAFLYARYAGKNLDPLAERLRHRLSGEKIHELYEAGEQK